MEVLCPRNRPVLIPRLVACSLGKEISVCVCVCGGGGGGGGGGGVGGGGGWGGGGCCTVQSSVPEVTFENLPIASFPCGQYRAWERGYC